MEGGTGEEEDKSISFKLYNLVPLWITMHSKNQLHVIVLYISRLIYIKRMTEHRMILPWTSTLKPLSLSPASLVATH